MLFSPLTGAVSHATAANVFSNSNLGLTIYHNSSQNTRNFRNCGGDNNKQQTRKKQNNSSTVESDDGKHEDEDVYEDDSGHNVDDDIVEMIMMTMRR